MENISQIISLGITPYIYIIIAMLLFLDLFRGKHETNYEFIDLYTFIIDADYELKENKK